MAFWDWLFGVGGEALSILLGSNGFAMYGAMEGASFYVNEDYLPSGFFPHMSTAT